MLEKLIRRIADPIMDSGRQERRGPEAEAGLSGPALGY